MHFAQVEESRGFNPANGTRTHSNSVVETPGSSAHLLSCVDKTRVDEAALEIQDFFLQGAIMISALAQQH